MQQAELLSSLTLKVNTENTEQSLENAWKVRYKFMFVSVLNMTVIPFVFLFLNVYLQHMWNRLKHVYPIIYYLNRYNVVKQINAFSLYAINVQLGIIFGYQFWTNLATFFFSQNEMNLFISSFCLAIGLVCWRKKTGDGTSRTREEAQLFAAEFSLKNLVKIFNIVLANDLKSLESY